MGEISKDPDAAGIEPLLDDSRVGTCLAAHELEQVVHRELCSLPGTRFSSLVVRRFSNGICLEGVLEIVEEAECPDVCEAAQRVAGVKEVLNHLLVRRGPRIPPKG